MRSRLALLATLVVAPLLAGCAAFPGGEPVDHGSRNGDGLPEPVQTEEHRGTLNVSAATSPVSAGDTVPLSESLGRSYFQGFTAVTTWNATGPAGAPAPHLQVAFRQEGSVEAIAVARGKSPLPLKVAPDALEGLTGPFELYISVVENGTAPVALGAAVPYHVLASAYFGPEGAAAFALFK